MGVYEEPPARQRGGFGRLSYSGTRPWPEVPVGNHDHNNAAVVIIGGGIAGMNMAIDLLTKRKVKSFIIIEKGGGFGGTWRDNKFPGCCCDVWSHLYCYSFEQNPDWSRAYPGQEEILNYLTDVAHKYQLYKYARFNTTVDEAKWNEHTMKWETTVNVAGGKDSEFGSQYIIYSDFLISAVGQLNLPRGVDIPGQEDFKGKIMHSARWDWSYSMKGKRVAIIGTGATTAQIVPEIAKEAAHLTVCQRSPAWVIPRHDEAIPEWKRQVLKWIPPIRWRYRAEAMDIRESFFMAVTDPTSTHAQHMRDLNASLLATQLASRPDLRAKLRPNYSPGCKRSVLSDDYYPALARPNVHLETSPIDHFTTEGLHFTSHTDPTPYDAIILATGFDTTNPLQPLNITGRANTPLSTLWHPHPTAHKGVTVPSHPNLGLLYGPNTNLSHNSLILMIEAQVRYLSALIGPVLHARAHGQQLSIEPRADVCAAYNAQLQAALQRTSFADPACTSWWKRGEDGWIVNNWRGSAVEYQVLLGAVDWTEFTVEGSGREAFERARGGGDVVRIGRVVEETRVGRLVVLAAVVVGALGFLGIGLGGLLGSVLSGDIGI